MIVQIALFGLISNLTVVAFLRVVPSLNNPFGSLTLSQVEYFQTEVTFLKSLILGNWRLRAPILLCLLLRALPFRVSLYDCSKKQK